MKKVKKIIILTFSVFSLSLPFCSLSTANPLVIQTEQREELMQIFDQLEIILQKQEQELLTAKQQQEKSEQQVNLLENQIIKLDNQLTKALITTDQATSSLTEVEKFFQDYRKQKNKEIKQAKVENLLLKLGLSYLIYDKIKN